MTDVQASIRLIKIVGLKPNRSKSNWPTTIDKSDEVKSDARTTNYINTFITVSPDSTASRGQVPAKPESIAGLQYMLLRDKPYALTSDDLLFEVYAHRNGIARSDRAYKRDQFFSQSLACLRASPLVKQYGWGLHHDENARVAAYGIETGSYRQLILRSDLKIVSGMRNRRF